VLAPFDTDPYGSARARMPYPLLSRPLSPSQSSLNIPRHMLLLCPLSSPTHPIKQQQGDSNFTHLTVPQPSSLDAFRSAQPDLFSRQGARRPRTSTSGGLGAVRLSQLPEGLLGLQTVFRSPVVTDRDDMDRDFFLFTREAEARPMADLDTILLRALMR
jgi:hypothetical protein